MRAVAMFHIDCLVFRGLRHSSRRHRRADWIFQEWKIAKLIDGRPLARIWGAYRLEESFEAWREVEIGFQLLPGLPE